MLREFMGISHVSNQGPQQIPVKKMVNCEWNLKKHWGERNFETNRTYNPFLRLHASLF